MTHPLPIDLTSPDTTITLESLRTGREFTYRIRRAPLRMPVWFVDVITGPRNEDPQKRLGRIEGIYYCHLTHSDFAIDDPHALAFSFWWACPAHPQLRVTQWENCQPD